MRARDYRTIRHHLEALEKHKLLASMGDRYGRMYFVSMELEEYLDVFDEIWVEIGKRLKKGGNE